MKTPFASQPSLSVPRGGPCLPGELPFSRLPAWGPAGVGAAVLPAPPAFARAGPFQILRMFSFPQKKKKEKGAIQYICPPECLKTCRSCLFPAPGPAAVHGRHLTGVGSPSCVHTNRSSTDTRKFAKAQQGRAHIPAAPVSHFKTFDKLSLSLRIGYRAQSMCMKKVPLSHLFPNWHGTSPLINGVE